MISNPNNLLYLDYFKKLLIQNQESKKQQFFAQNITDAQYQILVGKNDTYIINKLNEFKLDINKIDAYLSKLQNETGGDTILP